MREPVPPVTMHRQSVWCGRKERQVVRRRVCLSSLRRFEVENGSAALYLTKIHVIIAAIRQR